MTESNALIAEPPAARENRKGDEAAALLLLLFAEEEAAAVLSRLEPQEVQSLGEAMFAIANVTESDVNSVFDRFVEKAGSKTTIGYRSSQQISGMFNRALGSDRAENILKRIAPDQSEPCLEQLKWLSADELFAMIDGEHPQIVAVIVSHLSPDTAGEVVQMLPNDVQDDIIFRVATMGEVGPQAIDDIERLLAAHKRASSSSKGRAADGTTDAAAIMNNMGKAAERRIIRAVSKRDKIIARTIEDKMFVFEDLADLNDKDLSSLLRSVESDTLILALKGAEQTLAKQMFGCMSSRAAQSIQDEIEERGPVAKDEVVAAQKQVIALARSLSEDGTIQLGGQGDDYV